MNEQVFNTGNSENTTECEKNKIAAKGYIGLV